jgi:DNA-binding response OmpR family regulator
VQVATQRVLVVDDHADTAELLATMVACLGHETRCAHSGADALRLARDFDPDLVLLDLQLPDVLGYELVQDLRARPRYIAAVTCWGRDEDRMRSFKAGLDQHIVKPLDLPKLRQLIACAAQR